MNKYSITLTSESGPYFNILADDFEIKYNSYTHKPYMILFGHNNKIVCSVPYKDVYEIAQIISEEYIKIKF